VFHSPKPTNSDKENETTTGFHSPHEAPEESLHFRYRNQTPPIHEQRLYENPLSTPRQELPDYDPDAPSMSPSESISPVTAKLEIASRIESQSESSLGYQTSPRSPFSENALWSRLPISSLPWDHDDSVNACSSCKDLFSFLRRRHHCRQCGHLFCGNCSDKVLKNVNGYNHPVRACNECFQKDQWKCDKVEARDNEKEGCAHRNVVEIESCKQPCLIQ